MDKIIKIALISLVGTTFFVYPLSYLFYFFGIFTSFLGLVFFWVPDPYYGMLLNGSASIALASLVYLIYKIFIK